jgi:hypothetical protein
MLFNIILDDSENRNIIVKDRFNEKERYRFNEQEYLHFLYEEGRINIRDVTGQKGDNRQNLLLVIGRRGCKTSSIAVISAFETYKLLRKISPQQYYNMMPDDEIRITCIATNEKQANELFGRISGHLERSDWFKRFRTRANTGNMLLSTERDIEKYGIGKRPSIQIVASPCSGRGLRGHNNIVVVLDEMAHFFEAATATDKSDENIYESVTPSVAKYNAPDGDPHGKVICISSPNTRNGKFYDLYKRSFEADCNDILMIQAPTWEVDYTLSSRFLRSKYLENPISFDAEYGAQFSDRICGWIENEQILRMNIVPGLKPKSNSLERVPHFLGIDLAYKNDGSAICVCHIVKLETPNGLRNFIEIDASEVRFAKDEGKESFRVEEIADWIASFTQKFFIVKGLMDNYSGFATIPLLRDKGINQIEAKPTPDSFSSTIYQNLMSKLMESSIRIPEGEEKLENGKPTKDLPLVTELLKLRATSKSKYIISVEAPEGGHDDLSDSFSRAVWLATEYMNAGGNGVQSNTIIQSSGQVSSSYKKYYRKAKISAGYTKRPSSTLMSEMSQRSSMNFLNSYSMGRR